MLKISLLPFLLSIGLIFQACSTNNKQETSTKQATKNKQQENIFELTSVNGETITIEKTKDGFKTKDNKIIIFDIFATWCPPCQAEATHLTSLQKKYKNEIIILGISIEENIPNSKLEKFKDIYNAKYSIVNSNNKQILIDEILKSLDIGKNVGIPLVAMFNGKLITYYQGATEEEFIESDIKKALKK